jgi:MoaA/NifB/PqqE/SkfB family radical SAM enzyme
MNIGIKREEVLELELELTGICNLDCPLCSRSYENAQHLKVKHIRPLEEWIAHLDSFPNLRYTCLSGAVSEPTMYKDFLELIRYLNSRNINYDLYTNANTHKEEWWEELGTLVTHPKNRVLFTVCGTTQELHEKYRVGSSLEQVLRHAKAFRKSGTTTDWIQLIRFEYNKDNLESDDMKKIIEEFNHLYVCESAPYQERFKIIKDPNTDIRMAGKLGEKYNVIRSAVLKRYESGTTCTMKCKSFELKFLFVDNFGGEHPCFLHRIYDNKPFDHNDYSDIFKFKNKYCYECESMTKTMLERNGMERMG